MTTSIANKVVVIARYPGTTLVVPVAMQNTLLHSVFVSEDYDHGVISSQNSMGMFSDHWEAAVVYYFSQLMASVSTWDDGNHRKPNDIPQCVMPRNPTTKQGN
jgi:hypothetical protein